MSTLAVNQITDASGGATATINSFTPTVSNMAGRNRIINGDMRINQRATSVTSANWTVDRFYYNTGTASKGTAEQSTTTPTGFINSLLFTSSSAYSMGASEYFGFQQPIEGLNIADLAWGTASAKAVTISFWVRSSLTGTFGGSLRNSGAARSYVFSYTIDAANTWEQKSVTITGDTSGTWLTTNGVGIFVNFSIGQGTTLSGAAGSWSGSNYTGPTGQTSVVGTSGATFYITGVQLEAGSVATPFEHRQYGQELALCQRYYQTLGLGPYAGRGNGSTAVIYGIPTAVVLRASPTITTSGSAFAYYDTSSTSAAGSSSVLTFATNDTSFRAQHTGFTGLTDNRIYNLQFAASFSLSAEL